MYIISPHMSAISQPTGMIPQILQSLEVLEREHFSIREVAVKVTTDLSDQISEHTRKDLSLNFYRSELCEFFEEQTDLLSKFDQRGHLMIEARIFGFCCVEQKRKDHSFFKKIEMNVKTIFTEENLHRLFFSRKGIREKNEPPDSIPY